MAGVTRLSTCHFVRAFKRAFDETPGTYLGRRRMARAMELMLETEEPLSQIAIACGLGDQAHLSRLFRQSQGISPGRWRRVRREAAPAPSASHDASLVQIEVGRQGSEAIEHHVSALDSV